MNTGTHLFFSVNPPRVTLQAFDLPAPTEKQVLVRNTCTQASLGSEMNFFRDGPSGYGPNLNPKLASLGYMATGHIVETGSAVTDYHLGDRVAVNSTHASLCLIDTDRPAAISALPKNVADDHAGFVALGDVALHAIRRARLQIDESVVVFGTGMVGQLIIQLARISGADPIIAVDLLDRRLDLAQQSGASHTLNAAQGDVTAQIRAFTQGRGAEKSFMCASSAAVLAPMLESAADRGSIMITGSASGISSIRLREEILRKELTLIGTYESNLAEEHPYWTWSRDRNRRAYLRLLSSGQLQMTHLISHRVPATEAPALYQDLLASADDYLGVVFDWT